MSRIFQSQVAPMSTPTFGTKCEACRGVGIKPFAERCGKAGQPGSFCPECDGVGYLGVDPYEPSDCVAGSIERIVRYAARYRAGLPLWSESDFVPNVRDVPEWSSPLDIMPDEELSNDDDEA